MSREAEVLSELIGLFGSPPVRLVGHSDGGTIALLCAARHPHLVSDVLALAPHSWVEPKCVEAIRAIRHTRESVVPALARYHDHAAELFEAWSGAWTMPEFASWDVRPQIAAINCPVSVVQGENDEYATERMAWCTARAIGPTAEVVVVPGCRHAIHRHEPDLVVQLAARPALPAVSTGSA
jgi:pimeloyl-ACP methyl ester carboxylesterase